MKAINLSQHKKIGYHFTCPCCQTVNGFVPVGHLQYHVSCQWCDCMLIIANPTRVNYSSLVVKDGDNGNM